MISETFLKNEFVAKTRITLSDKINFTEEELEDFESKIHSSKFLAIRDKESGLIIRSIIIGSARSIVSFFYLSGAPVFGAQVGGTPQSFSFSNLAGSSSITPLCNDDL